jgi:hypothetical protein
MGGGCSLLCIGVGVWCSPSRQLSHAIWHNSRVSHGMQVVDPLTLFRCISPARNRPRLGGWARSAVCVKKKPRTAGLLADVDRLPKRRLWDRLLNGNRSAGHLRCSIIRSLATRHRRGKVRGHVGGSPYLCGAVHRVLNTNIDLSRRLSVRDVHRRNCLRYRQCHWCRTRRQDGWGGSQVT